MRLSDKRDVEMWATMAIGLSTGKQERDTWNCRIVGLIAAMVAAGFMGYVLGRSWLPMWARAVIVVVLFFGILYVARDVCRKRAIALEEADRAEAETAAAKTAAPAAAVATAPVAAAPAATPAEVAPPPAASADPVAAGNGGIRPEPLTAPREAGPDDLTLIRGVGPKLQQLCNDLGIYHYDQIAAWTDAEVAWMDDNLEGFKGRVSRDEWIAQAKELAAGKTPTEGSAPS